MTVPRVPELKDSHLSRVAEDVVENMERTVAVLEPLDGDALNWRPDPDSWSAGQCLQHLVTVDGLYHDAIGRAVRKGAARGLTRTGPFKGSRFGSWLVRAVGPAFKRPLKTPGLFRPEEGSVQPGIAQRFLRIQAETLDCIASADGLDLDRIRVRSPVSRFLHLRLGTALHLLVEHDKRHLAQAERVVAASDLPGS